MKRSVCIGFLSVFFLVGTLSASMGDIRAPAVAGKFYPEEKARLSSAISNYLKSAKPAIGHPPIALVSPHAGYVYSGQICADAFNQAAGYPYDLVVLLGTNHTSAGFSGVSIYPAGGYKTPLGVARIDEAVSGRLIARDPDFTYVPSVHTREHSIEVLVPFVQQLFPEAAIVAAVVGKPDMDLCGRFAKALAEELKGLKGRKSLIVASSDLSHYPSYTDAVAVDSATLDDIKGMAPGKFQETIQNQMARGVDNLATCACGEGPILVAMMAAKALGANCASVISYANSGDTAPGTRERVVGYGAVSFFKASDCPRTAVSKKQAVTEGLLELDRDSREKLLKLARDTIEQYLATGTTPMVRDLGGNLEVHRGAFVTLKKNGKLRGCIGHMAEDLPLCRVVSSMALQAAFNDPRFPPVSQEELGDIQIEISVLTPFRQVDGPEDIRVGLDGVVLRKNGRGAVFLPQVATEQGWQRDQMLEHLCRKAGLAPDDWKEGAQFLTFQAQVFGEKETP